MLLIHQKRSLLFSFLLVLEMTRERRKKLEMGQDEGIILHTIPCYSGLNRGTLPLLSPPRTLFRLLSLILCPFESSCFFLLVTSSISSSPGISNLNTSTMDFDSYILFYVCAPLHRLLFQTVVYWFCNKIVTGCKIWSTKFPKSQQVLNYCSMK